MEKNGIIEQRPSPWCSAVNIVTNADGSLRSCLDYRSTINQNQIKMPWPIPNLEIHLDTVGRARYVTVYDVQNAYRQIPVAASEEDTTFLSQRMESGSSNAYPLVELTPRFCSRW